jgi:hypothetical protein
MSTGRDGQSEAAEAKEKRRLDKALERGLEDSFPASDPVNDPAAALQGRP